ncbi:sporulation membrane protein YtaF [Desulfotomaculum copahuensis]|uniref:Sporulation membrane protein YtaF n=1 Tax=Desulfotomaculum copahuensis TaxID=1838280 RepID=A0A1B7LAM8_9FIRM|nr:sporulation membrane protein YtaF [Desulfotomaculum copahuensis]OAT79404.1 sporulation membrane protein YtaF [Desulfotomaculum copahuensis]
MELLTSVIFALALSMDAFGTGVAYGVRQIKLPLTSLLIISMLSMAALSLSMLAGEGLTRLFSVAFAQRLGGIVLLLIGLRILIQCLRHRKKKEDTAGGAVMRIHLRSLGLVIQVLREPHRADLDSSGVISPREAVLLGLALAMDALAAGFAVPMLGLNPALTALVVGLGQFTLANLGILAGKGLGYTALGRQFSALPGCILIALGLFKLR